VQQKCLSVVTCVRKAGITAPEETVVSKERLYKHISTATDSSDCSKKYVTIDGLLDVVFSMWSVPRLQNEKWLRPTLSSERSPHIKKSAKSLTAIKIWFWAPDGCLTPRHTGRLTPLRLSLWLDKSRWANWFFPHWQEIWRGIFYAKTSNVLAPILYSL
jgi:hypothetical protein